MIYFVLNNLQCVVNVFISGCYILPLCNLCWIMMFNDSFLIWLFWYISIVVYGRTNPKAIRSLKWYCPLHVTTRYTLLFYVKNNIFFVFLPNNPLMDDKILTRVMSSRSWIFIVGFLKNIYINCINIHFTVYAWNITWLLFFLICEYLGLVIYFSSLL